jgi:hypothetical protein
MAIINVTPPPKKSVTFACTQCSKPVEQYLPGKSNTLVCSSCFAILDASHPTLSLLQTYESKKKITPIIPLGKKGKFRGREFICLGLLVRRDKQWDFSWHEYLLYNPMVGYRWLVQSDAHWTYVTPTRQHAKVSSKVANYENKSFQLFHEGEAVVDFVLGEFYWSVKRGDTASVADYISPPEILSYEKTTDEVQWSIGEYTDRESIAKAFGLSDLRIPTGIAPHQLGMIKHSLGNYFFASLLLYVLILGVHWICQALSTGATLHDKSYYASVATIGSNETTNPFVLTDPVRIEGYPHHVRVKVFSDVSNGWVDVNAILINESTGESIDMNQEVNYYYGYEGGESWSEGDRSSEASVLDIPDGTYRFKISGTSDRPSTSFRIQIIRGSVGNSNLFAASILFWIWPLLGIIVIIGTEKSRWSESDHAPALYAGE